MPDFDVSLGSPPVRVFWKAGEVVQSEVLTGISLDTNRHEFFTGEIVQGHISIDREWTSYLSPDALEVVQREATVSQFLEGFLGMVHRQIEGIQVDVYLSKDSDEEAVDLVVRILGKWESEAHRMRVWEETTQDAQDLWSITLRNRSEGAQPIPLSILVW